MNTGRHTAHRLLLAALMLSFMALAFSSCSSDNKFKQPKFVKEWEVKKIIPDTYHRVLDITSNKYGVFVLVEASESKFVPPRLTYQIQHYNFNGDFVSSWPENNALQFEHVRTTSDQISVGAYDPLKEKFVRIDSRTRLVNPLRLASNEQGDIFLADYAGNKIVVFDRTGGVKNIFKYAPERISYEQNSRCKGFSVKDGTLYMVYQADWGFKTFNLSTFSTKDGAAITEIEHPLPEIRPFINPVIVKALKLKVPFINEPALIDDIAIDNEGNYYFLVGMQSIVKYDSNFNEVLSFDVILKDGFDTDVTYTDPYTGEKKQYGKEYVSLTGGFDSQIGANHGRGELGGPGYYDLGRSYITPYGQLVVTFIGTKPFGAMVAVVYDLDGKMLGYWKANNKSETESFRKLTDYRKLEASEQDNNMAFYDNNIFIGKTLSGSGLVHKYSAN